MDLQVAEQAFLSDTGRQREANEDSFFAGSPVFAVADGMGGAQAGEVASRVAAESIESAERGEGSPETYLRSIAEEANRRIHELAQEDSSRSGMGTTFTAAALEGEELSIAHVGDSRAYLFRDGELRLLTSDHSLVEELRRQGRLTEEQAEDHPQRSIITRALGPEPDVEVDTMTYRARPGDVYLLCSDGLTTMVKDDRIRAILAEAADLQTAAEHLIAEANAAGGRDNITVVAFRLEEAGVAVEEGASGAPEPGATLVGPAAEEAGLTAAGVAAERERQAEAARRPRRRRGAAEEAPPRRRRGRTALKVLAVLLILGVVVAGAVYGVRQVYFLGVDDAGKVALYRGLPYELPFGINLYTEQSAEVPIDSIPPDRQDSAVNHDLRSKDDATNLLRDLVQASTTAPSVSKSGEQPARKQGSGGRQGGSSQGGGRNTKSGGGGGGSGQGGQSGGSNG
jgi:serine/threonine protein phosphatase PrpC